jgi:hypothetical protein
MVRLTTMPGRGRGIEGYITRQPPRYLRRLEITLGNMMSTWLSFVQGTVCAAVAVLFHRRLLVLFHRRMLVLFHRRMLVLFHRRMLNYM